MGSFGISSIIRVLVLSRASCSIKSFPQKSQFSTLDVFLSVKTWLFGLLPDPFLACFPRLFLFPFPSLPTPLSSHSACFDVEACYKIY